MLSGIELQTLDSCVLGQSSAMLCRLQPAASRWQQREMLLGACEMCCCLNKHFISRRIYSCSGWVSDSCTHCFWMERLCVVH